LPGAGTFARPCTGTCTWPGAVTRFSMVLESRAPRTAAGASAIIEDLMSRQVADLATARCRIVPARRRGVKGIGPISPKHGAGGIAAALTIFAQAKIFKSFPSLPGISIALIAEHTSVLSAFFPFLPPSARLPRDGRAGPTDGCGGHWHAGRCVVAVWPLNGCCMAAGVCGCRSERRFDSLSTSERHD
jgi:hypothetical protein